MPLLYTAASPGTASWAAATMVMDPAGGNPRGTGAVDFQSVRWAADDVASGNYSFLPSGVACSASGDYSFAFGMYSNATGNYSTTMGTQSAAYADGAIVFGWQSYALEPLDIAIGSRAQADAIGYGYNTVIGSSSIGGASGYAINIGDDNGTYQSYNIAIGTENEAGSTGNSYALTIGQGCVAEKYSGIAIGYYARVYENYGIAIGNGAPLENYAAYGVTVGYINRLTSYAQFSTQLGGLRCWSNAPYTFCAGGRYAYSDHSAALFVSGNTQSSAHQGRSQLFVINLTDNGVVGPATRTLTSTGTGTNEITLPANGLYSIRGQVTAWNVTDNKASVWDVSVLAYTTAGVITWIRGQSVAPGSLATSTNDGAHRLIIDAAGSIVRFQGSNVLAKTLNWSSSLVVTKAATA